MELGVHILGERPCSLRTVSGVIVRNVIYLLETGSLIGLELAI